MPNAVDDVTLTVRGLSAAAQIRVDDQPNPRRPGDPYDIAFLYYAGFKPLATGFALEWYESAEARDAGVATGAPGGGSPISSNAPEGTPVDSSTGTGTPEAGDPLPAEGDPIASTVQRGRIQGGRAPTAKPDDSNFDEDFTYYGNLWILQGALTST